MKYTKRYLVFGVLVIAALVFKFNIYTAGTGEIRSFRGANLAA